MGDKLRPYAEAERPPTSLYPVNMVIVRKGGSTLPRRMVCQYSQLLHRALIVIFESYFFRYSCMVYTL